MEKNVPVSSCRAFQKCRLVIALGTLLFLTAAVNAQPIFVKDISSTAHHFVSANGQVYFASHDSLFVATPSDVTLVKKLNENIGQISDVTIGNKVFITASNVSGQQSLWVSSGTSATTVKVATYPTIVPVIAFNNDLYLNVDDGVHGTELWKLNSTNNLSILKDVNPGAGNGYGYSATVSNNLLYFSAIDGTSGLDLWKTDGTTSGTTKAIDMPFEHFSQLTDVNGTIFFEHDSLIEYDYGQLTELWKTTGTYSSMELVKSYGIEYYYNYLEHFTPMNGKLYFIRYYNIPDMDLEVSDGTEAGTYTVKQRINRDGYIWEMKAFQNYVVYYGNSQGFPQGMERSDGTFAGTSLVRRLNYVVSPSSMAYVDLTPAGDRLFFVDYGPSPGQYPSEGDELLLFESKADYSPETTRSLRELYNFPYDNTANVTSITGNDIMFTTTVAPGKAKLWFYDPDNSCSGTGGLTREVWTNISGNNTTLIPVNTVPNRVEKVTSFKGPVNEGDKYGARYSGYLCVPVTGNYQLMIASDDYSELYLSTTSSKADKTLVAYVHGATKQNEYTKYPSQKSVSIPLTKGTRYYIEALHKEGTTYDHISVAMKYPDGTIENPILGNHLIPFNANKAPNISIVYPTENQEYDANSNIDVTAEASDEDGTIARVEFWLYFKSNGYAYKLGVDEDYPYNASWTYPDPGDFTIVATAYDNEGGIGVDSVNFTVIGCTATGRIARELWTNVKGQTVSTIPLSTPPTSTGYLTSFEGPTNAGDYYGDRIRGYICAPIDGDYTFYIASDDYSELWLSDGSDPSHKVKIAYVNGATAKRQWDKYPSQKSAKIYLRTNHRYYVEVLHKENLGYDHVAVGWTMPNGISELPIPGSRLSPYESSSAAAARAIAEAEPASESLLSDDQFINLTPNPVTYGKVTMRTEGIEYAENSSMHVQIISLVGEVVYTKEIPCSADCNQIDLDLSGYVRPGVYLVKGATGGKSFTRRLVVK